MMACDSAHSAGDYNHKMFTNDDSNHIDGLTTGIKFNKRYQYYFDHPIDGDQEALLVEHVNNLSKEQVVQQIQDIKALPYIAKVFERRLFLFQYWNSQKNLVEFNADFQLPSDLYADKASYMNQCFGQVRTHRQIIRDLYNMVLELQKHSIAAASSNLLDDISLNQLKAKMSALQPGFQETCELLGEPKQQLVWNSSTCW